MDNFDGFGDSGVGVGGLGGSGDWGGGKCESVCCPKFALFLCKSSRKCRAKVFLGYFFVTCHMSPKTKATAHSPVNSPTMHSRLVHQNSKKFITKKKVRTFRKKRCYFHNFIGTHFEQNSLALLVPVTDRGDIQNINGHSDI